MNCLLPRLSPLSGILLLVVQLFFCPACTLVRPGQAEASPEPLPPQPKRPEIVSAVKEQAWSIASCLKHARVNREIGPGKYTFALNWKVNPDGSVSDIRLVGPASARRTSLPRCFGRKMSAWQFPASKRGISISSFPIGPVNIR